VITIMPFGRRFIVCRLGYSRGPRPRPGLWPGMVSAKIVYDALAAGGAPQQARAAVRPFSTTPLHCGGGACGFHVVLAEKGLVEALARGLPLLLPQARLDCREEGLEEPMVPARCRMTIGLEMLTPTILRFSGITLRYPSPRALIVSAARVLRWLTGRGLERATVAGMVMGVELAGYRVRGVRVNMGKGRLVEGIVGTATLVARLSGQRLRGLLLALQAANLAGLGKNRALGLGRVRFSPEAC